MLLSATDIVANINSYLQIIIMILIFFTGILLTSRNRFMQITKFGYSMKKTIGKTVSESINELDRDADVNEIADLVLEAVRKRVKELLSK